MHLSHTAKCVEVPDCWLCFGVSEMPSRIQPANAGDVRDMGSTPGLGRSPGGAHSNPLQCSCLESPMARGAWLVIVHRVAQSQTRLEQLSSHSHLIGGDPNAGKYWSKRRRWPRMRWLASLTQ